MQNYWGTFSKKYILRPSAKMPFIWPMSSPWTNNNGESRGRMYMCAQSQLTATLLTSIVAAVFGSLQIGYHTGNVNAPARVSGRRREGSSGWGNTGWHGPGPPARPARCRSRRRCTTASGPRAGKGREHGSTQRSLAPPRQRETQSVRGGGGRGGQRNRTGGTGRTWILRVCQSL